MELRGYEIEWIELVNAVMIASPYVFFLLLGMELGTITVVPLCFFLYSALLGGLFGKSSSEDTEGSDKLYEEETVE